MFNGAEPQVESLEKVEHIYIKRSVEKKSIIIIAKV